ncbi:MAG: hypothetical protein OXR07_05990 [Nitrospira sp.]|nr:hypothetical protein [Nitrospira sp.]MDD9859630.1 hypothetical protein [Nitrospira sp.]
MRPKGIVQEATREIVREAFEEMKKRGEVENRGGKWEIRARITDDIFLCVKNDVALKLKYDKALEAVKNRNKDSLNCMIGKAVKAVFGLVDAGQRNDPKSPLIKSYMSFEVKYVI